MKYCDNFLRLGRFISVAIICSSLFTAGCTPIFHQVKHVPKDVLLASKDKDYALVNTMDEKKLLEKCQYHYYTSNKYDVALGYCKKAAEKGIAEAQYLVGLIYYTGKDGDGIGRLWRKYDEAFKWFKMSAEQNYRRSYFYLGLLYADGDGVDKDYQKAVEWYQKAAETGDAAAQNNLGNMYEDGDGVEEDYAKALYWYKHAAANGDSVGEYNVGRFYLKGIVVEEDYCEAIEHFKASCKLGCKEGCRKYEDTKGLCVIRYVE